MLKTINIILRIRMSLFNIPELGMKPKRKHTHPEQPVQKASFNIWNSGALFLRPLTLVLMSRVG